MTMILDGAPAPSGVTGIRPERRGWIMDRIHGRRILVEDVAAFDRIWVTPSGGTEERLITVTGRSEPYPNGRVTIWGVFTGTQILTWASVPADGTVTVEED